MASLAFLGILLLAQETLVRALLYPDTKWCGPGTTAVDYDDLGPAKEEDSCCRAHDHCFDYLLAGQSSPERGLHNTSPFTKLHCKCDSDFRDCLMRVNSHLSRQIGNIYFAVQGTCYKLEYPLVGCNHENIFEAFYVKKKQFINRVLRKISHQNQFSSASTCLNYQVDRSRPKKWQWLNLPFFSDTKPHPVFDFSEAELA